MTPEKQDELLEKATEKANAMYSEVKEIMKQAFGVNEYIENQQMWAANDVSKEEFTMKIMTIEILTGMIISNAINNIIIHSKMPVSDIFDYMMHNVRAHAEFQLEHYLSKKK